MPVVGLSVFAIILLFEPLQNKGHVLILCEEKKFLPNHQCQLFSNINHSESEKKILLLACEKKKVTLHTFKQMLST